MKISNRKLKKLKKEGMNPNQIANACGISRQAVYQRLNYTSKTKRKQQLARLLVNRGYNYEQLQKALGHKTRNSTYIFMKRLGLNDKIKKMPRGMYAKNSNIHNVFHNNDRDNNSS